MGYYSSLLAAQVFLPLYINGCPGNFFDKETSNTFVLAFMIVIGVQMITLYFQQKLGPRFFVPYELRRDPNAHVYFHKFSRRAGSNDPERAEAQPEENIECVICMNKIIYEIGSDGNVINLSGNSASGSQIEMEQIAQDSLNESTEISESQSESSGNYKKAKHFMRTPCGHRYHPVCLKKWMERKLECPFCRQAIPPIDE